ncbi:MAG: hypothetical protein HC877_23505 [Thioploca sp.]|nr:hypothetical protein [Thioploca sp.]
MVQTYLESKIKEAISLAGGNYEPKVLSILIDYYNEPDRYYHNQKHIVDMLQLFDNSCKNLPFVCYSEILLACIFHDMIYIPGRQDNEKRSADYTSYILRTIKVPDSSCTRIMQMINGETRSIDEQIFHDLDYSILGSNENDYKIYKENIKKEYLLVTDEMTYNTGRLAFLEKNESSCFLTEYFKDNFEKQATINIKK